MITTEIKFSGVEYPCRMVKDNQGEYLIIGSTDLLDALQPGNFEDENEGLLPMRKPPRFTTRFSSSPMSVPLPCPTRN